MVAGVVKKQFLEPLDIAKDGLKAYSEGTISHKYAI